MKRLKYIDFIKGIAIMLVVFGHIPHKENNHFVIWIYSFHIPLFFILSGYLISYRKNNYSFKKLFNTLIYPYFTLSFLSISFSFILSIIANKKFIDLPIAIQKTIFLDGYSTLWFLPSLFLAETIFHLVKKFFSKKEFIFYIIILVLTSYFSDVIDFRNYSFLNVFNRALIGSIFIYIGYLLEKVIFKKHYLLNVLSLFFIFLNLFICNLNGNVDLHFSIINNPILYYLFSITTSFSILYLCKNIYEKFSLNLKLTQYIGNNSMIIMATHLPFLILGLVYSLCNINNNSIKSAVVFVIVMVIELIIIFFTNKYFKFVVDGRLIKNKTRC